MPRWSSANLDSLAEGKPHSNLIRRPTGHP